MRRDTPKLTESIVDKRHSTNGDPSHKWCVKHIEDTRFSRSKREHSVAEQASTSELHVKVDANVERICQANLNCDSLAYRPKVNVEERRREEKEMWKSVMWACAKWTE
jgi:hypothetical protein